MSTILITGATGFLGRRLCDYFREKGDTVRGLARQPSRYPFHEPGVTLFACDLPDRMDTRAFEGVDLVIHCAYATRIISVAEASRVNHIGTMRVYEASQRANVGQFVFVSSVGSGADAESYYGKSKFAAEQLMDSAKDLIIRPGLILGPGEDGTFNRMKQSLLALGVVPIFDGGHQIVQTIYIDDLCEAIDRATQKKLTGVLAVVAPNGLEIREFFQRIAARFHKRVRFIPLPMASTLRLLRVIEMLRIPFPLSSENILGLKYLRQVSSEADLAKIGITVKSVDEGLEASL